MPEAKNNYSAGEKVLAADLNQISKNANDGGSFRDTLNAGETLNGATLPVPVYQNTSDNELYACDANDTAKLNFIGFVIGNSTDGNPIDFQGNGIVRGFTGLLEGEMYYVQDTAGTIGISPGTYGIQVGRAISETEIEIIKATSPVGVAAVTSSPALGTTYQNTYKKTIWVMATLRVESVFGDGTTEIQVKMDSSSPPTTVIGGVTDKADTGGGAGPSGTGATVTFPVPPGFYWRYDASGSAPAVSITREIIFY